MGPFTEKDLSLNLTAEMFAIYEIIMGESYQTSEMEGKEHILGYMTYLLEWEGFSIDEYPFSFDEKHGVVSIDLLRDIIMFKAWNIVPQVKDYLLTKNEMALKLIKTIANSIKGYKFTNYSLKDYFGALVTLHMVSIEWMLSNQETLNFIRNNTSYQDEKGNNLALRSTRVYTY